MTTSRILAFGESDWPWVVVPKGWDAHIQRGARWRIQKTPALDIRTTDGPIGQNVYRNYHDSVESPVLEETSANSLCKAVPFL